MKVAFSPPVIAELRRRVIEHNELLKSAGASAKRETALTKLTSLKDLYKRFYNGADPHQHALMHIDAHLERLRDRVLAKVEGRDERGRFSSGGGSGGGGSPPDSGQHGFFGDVARPEDHQNLADSNAGYDASQTQIIPETRYSVFGPPIAGAAGIGVGAIAGASAKFGGGRLDHAQTRALGWAGGKLGQLTGRAVVRAPVVAGRMVARGAIGAINRTYGTTYARPSATAGDALLDSAERIGGAAGRALGHGAGEFVSYAANVFPATGKRLARALITPRFGTGAGRAAGILAGAVVGAGVPGLAYGSSLFHLQSAVGPYVDAAFPRRVRKIAGPMLEAPEVLAKQADLLQKANFRGAVAGARRVIATLWPSVASHSIGEQVGIPWLGQAKMAEEFGVRRGGGIRYTAKHAAVLGAAGAGVGAIAGAAYDHFDPTEHPRGEGGRFARSGQHARLGAKIGAAVGIGAGVVAGVVAAREGHTALLRAALARLGAAATGMHDRATLAAREVHAKTYIDEHKEIGHFAPGVAANHPAFVTTPTHQLVKEALERNAVNKWSLGEGAAIRDGARSWYPHQIDVALDKAAMSTQGPLSLRAVADLDAKGKRLPLLDKTGRAVQGNLINTLDEEKLNPKQLLLWTDLVKHRKAALASFEKIHIERAAETQKVGSLIKELETRRNGLQRDLTAVPDRLSDFDHDDTSLASIRTFAKTRMGHDLVAKTRKAALEELENVHNDWEVKVNAELGFIADEMKLGEPALQYARGSESKDLTDAERVAIRNPFSKKPEYFAPVPNFDAKEAEVKTKASRDFLHDSNIHARVAADHLNTLIAVQQAALEAGIPKHGLLGTAFERHVPELAGRMQQAAVDYEALVAAHRGSLKGTLKDIYDFLHANTNWKTAGETAQRVGASAAAKAKKVGAFALQNSGKLSTALGLATSIGVIDASSPTRPFQINTKKWKRPKDIRVINEPVGGLNRRGERLMGLSYRNAENQQVFMYGHHVFPKKDEPGASAAVQIPFGSNVEQIRNEVRNRDNQQGSGSQNQVKASTIEVADPKSLNETVDKLRRENHIVSTGPANAQFRERRGGSPGKADQDMVDGLFKKHLAFIGPKYKHATTNKPVSYWNSLKDLFESHGTEVLDQNQRAELLVGNATKRGIFGNPDNVYGESATSDKGRVLGQLRKQIAVYTPTNADEHKQIQRAIWLIAQHYSLPAIMQSELTEAVDKAYTNATAATPPTGKASAAAKTTDEYLRDLQERLTEEIPESHRPEEWRTNEEFRDTIDKMFRGEIRRAREQTPLASDEDIHHVAARKLNSWIDRNVMKQEPLDGLRKFLSWSGASDAIQLPKTPAIAGAAAANGDVPGETAPAKPPAIAGAAATAAPGAAGPQRGRLHNAFRGTLGGSYAGGEAGFQLANAASNFIPGGGLISTGLRALAPAVGGIVGGQVGQSGALNPNHPTAGSLGGLVVGAGATSLATKPGKQLAQAAIDKFGQTGAGQAISGAANRFAQTGVGQKIGGAIANAQNTANLPGLGSKIAGSSVGQSVKAVGSKIAGAATRLTGGFFQRAGAAAGEDVGGVAGDIAGTAVEPGGGTLAGNVAGTAIGGAIGAGAGYLADEGISALYRALSGYGPHVANQAAATLGVPPATRARHAASITPAAPAQPAAGGF